jgi:hypothetical protein
MKSIHKTLSILTAIAYFSTQVALGSLAESNLWKERRANTVRNQPQLA